MKQINLGEPININSIWDFNGLSLDGPWNSTGASIFNLICHSVHDIVINSIEPPVKKLILDSIVSLWLKKADIL